MKFSDVDWGKDEAKGDSGLSSYFFKFRDFEKIRKGEYRYIIGRKGTGKTAIIEKIKQELQIDAKTFHSSLTLRDFPIQDFRGLRDKSYTDKSQFVPIWQFLIYVELFKLILNDHSIDSNIANKLDRFLQINKFNNNMGFTETIKELNSNDSKIKVFAKFLSGERSNSHEKEETTSIHYNKMVKSLEEKLFEISTECEYWLFVDELDEGFKAGDSNIKLLLLSLLRALETVALTLNEHNFKFRPLLVLRSDIFDSLDDNDLNKLDDYVIRLKWSSDENNQLYSLKNIVDARIKSSLPKCSHNPWKCIVQDKDSDLPEKIDSTWKYIANRTYERPRDIIKFLKYCKDSYESNNNTYTTNQLSFKEVKKAEEKFSDWLYKELRDEIQSYLPCWKEVFQAITAIGKGKFSQKDLVDQISKNSNIQKWLDDYNKESNEIIELLFNFGILGNLDGKRWLFKYKDEDLAWNESMELIVHFGLHKKLRIKYSPRRYD